MSVEPLPLRLLYAHDLACVCSLCTRHLIVALDRDPFVRKVVSLLHGRGLNARAVVSGGGEAIVYCAHPYGLQHAIRFRSPQDGKVWGSSSSGNPMSAADVAWLCMSRARSAKRDSA